MSIIRRFEMTKKFNLRFCLQSSTKVTIFKTLLALLDITSMSRFETDRIFLKRNFKIWILFFHFPLFVFISNDLLILRHFNWIWIKSITQIFVFWPKFVIFIFQIFQFNQFSEWFEKIIYLKSQITKMIFI